MAKVMFGVLIVLLIATGGCVKKEKVAITIDNIQLTAAQFDKAFKSSHFARNQKDGRKEFLDVFIDRKLLLHEADLSGLDKDPRFLSDFQFLWESALTNQVILKRMKEFPSGVQVGDAEINAYYNQNKENNFAGRQLSEVYAQIKYDLLRLKESAEIKEWILSLKNKANIKIDYGLLGIKN